MPVFYGMLANDFYQFGTRVYIPVIGITGVVEDRIGSFSMWNHFDVWSPTCYGTPTGWYRVAIQTG
jgi:3D (Asp-Asp-Asp) domain-containing protein